MHFLGGRLPGLGLVLGLIRYTLAVIAAYLYAARMLDAFAGLSVLLPRVRNHRIAEATRGCTYGLGWTCGATGVRRVGIDEEALDHYKTF